jgi:hypothetical protein
VCSVGSLEEKQSVVEDWMGWWEGMAVVDDYEVEYDVRSTALGKYHGQIQVPLNICINTNKLLKVQEKRSRISYTHSNRFHAYLTIHAIHLYSLQVQASRDTKMQPDKFYSRMHPY